MGSDPSEIFGIPFKYSISKILNTIFLTLFNRILFGKKKLCFTDFIQFFEDYDHKIFIESEFYS